MTNNLSYGRPVENIQRYLRRLADKYGDRSTFAIPIDGIYDTKTREAVSEFQRINSLPVTGTVDRITWDLLLLEYRDITEAEDRRVYIDFFPKAPPNYETDFGEESAFISILQFVLDELRASYDTLPTFERSGIYDGDTSLAVKEFQRIHALPMTGRVNRRTWNEISDAYNIYG